MKPWRVLTLALSMVAINLVGINQAHAVADGTVDCGTSGTFTIVSNIVTTNTNCRGSLSIPEGVTEIANGAFNQAPDRSSFITSIIFPNSLTTIKESAFRAASSLTSIEFGTGIQSIVHWNFADSTALTSVTIPSSVISIGVGVFYGSTLLESVTFLGNAPSVDSNAFNGLKAGAVANVSSSATGFGANGSTWKYLRVSVAVPAPSAPGAPTIGTATALSPTSATVSFTAPTSNGGATIETYTATSTPGSITGRVLQSGSGSITLTGLTSSTAYTFRVTASNSVGTSSSSAATVSLTTPASQAEIDAAALAAQKIAEAKRETEKRAARLDISNYYYNSIIPTYTIFNKAQFYSVTAFNLPYISNDIIAHPAYERNNIFIIENVINKYMYLDVMCSSERINNIYSTNLSAVGLFPKANQSAIMYSLRKLPLSERNSYAKIMQAIDYQMQVIKTRKYRLAAIKSYMKTREPLRIKP